VSPSFVAKDSKSPLRSLAASASIFRASSCTKASSTKAATCSM
jgi:hypothetical protein